LLRVGLKNTERKNIEGKNVENLNIETENIKRLIEGEGVFV